MSLTSSWTDDRVETLARLWKEGLSASQIACRLGGVTRNAVIGKVHRLGLSSRAVPAPPGSRRARAPKAEPRFPRTRLVVPRRAWPPLAEPVPEGGLTDMLSVGPHACRWPMGDPKAVEFAICGRPAVRGAYCAPHGALAYRPVAGDHLLKLAGLS